jgi:hypothetical protein
MTEALREVGDLNGWDVLDLDNQAYKNLQRVSEEEAAAMTAAFHACFTAPAGKKVLDRLIAMTLISPTIHPNDTQFQAGIREGRADLVRQILREIARAENL